MNPNPPTTFEANSPYRRLAQALDRMPQRFPPAENEAELRVLGKIFTPDEAEIAAVLGPVPQTAAEVAALLGRDQREIAGMLKDMTRRSLAWMAPNPQGRLGFGLMPFIVGFYEAQLPVMDEELARLVEDYFQHGFARTLAIQPQAHRVIPVRESVRSDLAVKPYESVSALLEASKAWAVQDCICRVQKALIGDGCEHPVEVCLMFGGSEHAFDNRPGVRALTLEGAREVLDMAAKAGLVHCVSNHQDDVWYVCNCCTCSCGILRAMKEMGMAQVVAHSGFVNSVDERLCEGCEACVDVCMFDALTVQDGLAQVTEIRCAGCGVCVAVCPTGALALVEREDVPAVPVSMGDWFAARSGAGDEPHEDG